MRNLLSPLVILGAILLVYGCLIGALVGVFLHLFFNLISFPTEYPPHTIGITSGITIVLMVMWLQFVILRSKRRTWNQINQSVLKGADWDLIRHQRTEIICQAMEAFIKSEDHHGSSNS